MKTGLGPQPVRADKGLLHGALFGLLLAEAIVTAIYFAVFNRLFPSSGFCSMLAGCIVCVVALVRQGNTDLPKIVGADGRPSGPSRITS